MTSSPKVQVMQVGKTRFTLTRLSLKCKLTAVYQIFILFTCRSSNNLLNYFLNKMYISYFYIAQKCRSEELALESLSIVSLDTVMPI